MAYQLSGESEVFDWLARESDPAARERLMEWLGHLCEDPASASEEAMRVPGSRLQQFVAHVPDTNAVVTYFYANYPMRVVRIQRIARFTDP